MNSALHDFYYCACYCEENIWYMCQHDWFKGCETQVIFISNAHEQCAIWQQKASSHQQWPILWDYHVILAVKQQQNWCVFDLDSRLSLGSGLHEYLSQSFDNEFSTVKPQFQAQFKVIKGEDYIAGFSSSRDHMKSEQGQWLSPAPDWPRIEGDGRFSLTELRDFSASSTQPILTLEQLKAYF